jgi:chondroitin 4-sulfotransferase 11
LEAGPSSGPKHRRLAAVGYESYYNLVRRPSKYIVSDEHRFVYCVVQKVACSSIKTALLPLFDLDVAGHNLVREDQTTEVHRLFAGSGHEISGEEFAARMAAGRYDGYFTFAFVRNPWDRLVSCYRQKLSPEARDNAVARRFARRGAMDFSEFAATVCEIPDERANPHFRSQHFGLLSAGGDRLMPTLWVGRFENLAEDFAQVADRIGAPHLRLPHLTPSPEGQTPDYRDHYGGGLAEKDVELFDYSF